MGKLVHGAVLTAATDVCGLNNAVDRNLHMRHDLTDDSLAFGTGGACHLLGLWAVAHRRGVVLCIVCC